MNNQYTVAERYFNLREQVLSLSNEQLGIDTPTLAILMETGYPDGVVTLIAVADGTSSLYFSNDNGIIGAGEYQQVHDAALALISLASENLDKLSVTQEFPLPENGYTRFSIVTSSGVYTCEALEDDLGNERHALSPVFFQGHELISYINAAEEHRATEQDNSADHKQSYRHIQVVADGLEIELLKHYDLTYQIIPAYDDTESVLASWDGDDLLYFSSFSRLPPGWLNADVWIAGFTRDINAASEGKSLRILDKGHFKSEGGFDIDFIKVSFMPKEGNTTHHQLIYFITDHKNSYLTCATATSDSGRIRMLLELNDILKTAHRPASNITPLIRKNEDKYIGIWSGGYEDKLKNYIVIIFELKADLSFTRKDIKQGKSDSVYTGLWSISGNSLHWTYLYGKPTSQGNKSTEMDIIKSLQDDTLILISENGTEITMHKTR